MTEYRAPSHRQPWGSTLVVLAVALAPIMLRLARVALERRAR